MSSCVCLSLDAKIVCHTISSNISCHGQHKTWLAQKYNKSKISITTTKQATGMWLNVGTRGHLLYWIFNKIALVTKNIS